MSPIFEVAPPKHRRCHEPQLPCRDGNYRSAPTWSVGKPRSRVSQVPPTDRAPTASPPHRVAPDRRAGSARNWDSSATGTRYTHPSRHFRNRRPWAGNDGRLAADKPYSQQQFASFRTVIRLPLGATVRSNRRGRRWPSAAAILRFNQQLPTEVSPCID
jgi:hypothetical protein